MEAVFNLGPIILKLAHRRLYMAFYAIELVIALQSCEIVLRMMEFCLFKFALADHGFSPSCR